MEQRRADNNATPTGNEFVYRVLPASKVHNDQLFCQAAFVRYGCIHRKRVFPAQKGKL